MMDTFAPEDNERDDNDYHKHVRAQALLPTHMADDREFTTEEKRITVESMKKKAPGDDGITGDIYNYAFKTLPKFLTAMYNGCLKHGIFRTRWKTAKLIPVTKPGKENSYDVTKNSSFVTMNCKGVLSVNLYNSQAYMTPGEQGTEISPLTVITWHALLTISRPDL